MKLLKLNLETQTLEDSDGNPVQIPETELSNEDGELYFQEDEN